MYEVIVHHKRDVPVVYLKALSENLPAIIAEELKTLSVRGDLTPEDIAVTFQCGSEFDRNTPELSIIVTVDDDFVFADGYTERWDSLEDRKHKILFKVCDNVLASRFKSVNLKIHVINGASVLHT